MVATKKQGMQSMKFSIRIYVTLIIAIVFLSSRVTFAQGTTEETAQFLCTHVFNDVAYEYKSSFSDSFVKAIPEVYFRELVKEATEAAGPCIRTLQSKSTDDTAEYRLQSIKGNSIRIIFAVDSSGRISGLQILDVSLESQKIATWDDAASVVNSWEGQTSFHVVHFGIAEQDLRGNEVQPLGSVFKLYVLGALVDTISSGKMKWQDQFPLRDEYKSLPSGVMHTWPAGQMVSLFQFAENMIKISDNTATDHLLNILGRKTVEEQLITLKNGIPEKNIPFLTTAEMFKLKWAAPAELQQSYLKSTNEVRRHILESSISSIPLSQVGTNGLSMNTPTFTHELEWFASTRDVCSAMQGLQDKNSEEALKILAQNVPLIQVNEDSHWQYAGFKGGSEPGVIAASYLLRSKSGETGCVAITWNNTLKNVNQWTFFDAVGKILKLAEQSIL